MKNFLLLITTLLSLVSIQNAQIKRETRAVWVTTNFQLDWPPKTYDQSEQKKSLEEIFNNLKERNFNTVYFQVRNNGTVFYNSVIEPYSPYLTGTVGAYPSYDPLQYAIDLGKKYNIEVHAWINMIRCFSGSDYQISSDPLHIKNIHPEWVKSYIDETGTTSYWLNPGLPKVREHLVRLLLEISSNYDIDGIHLDFFRYPGINFDDNSLFLKSGLNITKDDWRRENITNILREFQSRGKPKNEFLKIGATPIGIRKNQNGAVGWEGYSQVFQDSEKWLEEKLVDYLVPQIYWNFNRNPKFDIVAQDWVSKSYHRNIILGLAGYKDDVKPQLTQMLEYSRQIGAAGVSIFRYENILELSTSFFDDLAFPTNMPWKEKNIPNHSKKIHVNYDKIADDEVMLEWRNGITKDDNFYRSYALFNTTNSHTTTKLISLDKTKVKLKFAEPSRLAYNYRVGEISRLWNIVNLSYQVPIKVPFLEKMKFSSFVNPKPILYSTDELSSYLSITSMLEDKATIDIMTKENLGEQKIIDLKFGTNIVKLDYNFRLLKNIRIAYHKIGKTEELNFM